MADDANDPHILGPGLLPTPFTADEIRAGCPDGRYIRLRVEADGKLVGYRTNVFRDGDAEGATVESQRFDPEGHPDGDPAASRATWLGFQRHAAFPADRTTRVEEVVDTPMGRLPCLRYTTSEEDGSIGDYWFARAMPGMPIRYQSEASGRLVSRVTVIENRLPS